MLSDTTAIERLDVEAYTIPTQEPESDGTLEWDATTLVMVEVHAGGTTGLGYTYADLATASLVRERLGEVVCGLDAMDVEAAWLAMYQSVRNLGRAGIASMAISAIDAALWDLKARLLGLPLVRLLGQVHAERPVYGSGGFTSFDVQRLREQLERWVGQGIPLVKMKVGRDPSADPERVRHARQVIGAEAELFVDANGAYDRKQALAMAEVFARCGVVWFEEPVSSDDLEGLRLLRDRAPARMEITAGEYGYELDYFRRMLAAGAVDVMMPDATRCGGITGFRKAATLCEASHVPVSSHCAPALHLHVCCALANVRHMELFYDHARIERMLFDGVVEPRDGRLCPDLSRPGFGLELKRSEAERYRR
jgi:L-alanine-DL-glutamate epimerase-like enolase superfamily enzyme